MSRLARPATRLATGSSLVLRRLAARAAGWCARGRRTDLTGWRAVLGILLRLALLAFGVYLLARIVRALPALMWPLTTGWVAASWHAGRAPKETAKKQPPADAQMDPRAVLVHWLDRLTRDRSGIHLDELHQTLIRHPDLGHLKRPEMRAWLDRHHITVDRTLRVGTVAGRSGISRATIEALLQTLSPLPETTTVEPVVHSSDLHRSPAESSMERDGEPSGEPCLDDVVRLLA